MPHTFICPNCHTPIALDQALSQEAHDTLQKQLEITYAKQLEEQKEELTLQAKKDALFLQEQLAEKKKKLEEAQQFELELRKKEAALQEQARSQELDIARRIDQERENIQKSLEKTILEQVRIREQQKEKQIQDLQRLLEDAQRKATQGSQQTQGEVQELALENELSQAFPDDAIAPVAKGVSGADIAQTVRSSKGTACGTLLWEVKQTKTWVPAWIDKLKNDQRQQKAEIAIIVTRTYTDPHWTGITYKDGVWITTFSLAIGLALALRKSLLDVGRERAMALHRGEKTDLLYSYITSQAFRQQIESIASVYAETKSQIDRERAAMEKIWKMREGQMQRLSLGLSSVYGTISGLVGTAALPELSGIELLPDGE